MTAHAKRALAFLVEPAESTTSDDGSSACPHLDVGVTGLSGACGTSTVALGLRRELPSARVMDGVAPAAGGVLVVVAGRAGLPVLACLVTDRLRARHPCVVLVANRPGDPEEWERAGAMCVPHSRLGVLLLAHGRRARGPFGAALRAIAHAVQESAVTPEAAWAATGDRRPRPLPRR